MIASRQLTLSGSPIIPEVKKDPVDLPGKPVMVRQIHSDYTNTWLEFRCPYYHPRGGDPDYPVDKYNPDSQDCSWTVLVQDGVTYAAPFSCMKHGHGSELWAKIKLPDRFTPKHERAAITAGLKQLWRMA